MTELDADLGPLAADTIAEFGKSVSFVTKNVGNGNYDTATGKYDAPAASAPKKVKVVPDDIGGRTSYNGNTIEGNDVILLQAAVGTSKPNSGDQYILDDGAYSVIENGVTIVYSGDLPCLYQVHVRR